MLQKQKRITNRKLLNQIKTQPCCICNHPGSVDNPIDPSHIRSVGSRGPDTDWNVLPMCRKHHTELGAQGHITFCFKHQGYQMLLEKLGWEIDERNKLWHPLLNDSGDLLF